MRPLLKAAVEGLIIMAAVVAIVGEMVAFVVTATVAAEKLGVWVFPSLILGAYVLYVIATWAYYRRKEVKRNDMAPEAVPGPPSSRPSSVVKLDDLTVSRAIQEANERRYIRDSRLERRTPDDAA